MDAIELNQLGSHFFLAPHQGAWKWTDPQVFDLGLSSWTPPGSGGDQTSLTPNYPARLFANQIPRNRNCSADGVAMDLTSAVVYGIPPILMVTVDSWS